MMKRLLFIAIFLTLTTTSCASSTNMNKSLPQQYKAQRQSITMHCTAEAQSLMPTTKNRDAGVPIEAVINRLLNVSVKEYEERAYDWELTIEDVLLQVGIINVIYYSSLTQEEIFNSQFRLCESEALNVLNTMYEYSEKINNGR